MSEAITGMLHVLTFKTEGEVPSTVRPLLTCEWRAYDILTAPRTTLHTAQILRGDNRYRNLRTYSPAASGYTNLRFYHLRLKLPPPTSYLR